MIKASLIIFFSLMSCSIFSQETTQPIFDEDGQYLGDVWTDRNNWLKCDPGTRDEDTCPETVQPVVCMTYFNECIRPIVCELEVSALLIEPFTGFTKKVTDVREEVVFFNQEHEVCFNFSKDIYNAWFLIDTSDPKISCEALSTEQQI